MLVPIAISSFSSSSSSLVLVLDSQSYKNGSSKTRCRTRTRTSDEHEDEPCFYLVRSSRGEGDGALDLMAVTLALPRRHPPPHPLNPTPPLHGSARSFVMTVRFVVGNWQT